MTTLYPLAGVVPSRTTISVHQTAVCRPSYGGDDTIPFYGGLSRACGHLTGGSVIGVTHVILHARLGKLSFTK